MECVRLSRHQINSSELELSSSIPNFFISTSLDRPFSAAERGAHKNCKWIYRIWLKSTVRDNTLKKERKEWKRVTIATSRPILFGAKAMCLQNETWSLDQNSRGVRIFTKEVTSGPAPIPSGDQRIKPSNSHWANGSLCSLQSSQKSWSKNQSSIKIKVTTYN